MHRPDDVFQGDSDGAPEPPRTNTVVLIAEDNQFDRTILRRAFTAAGSNAELRFFANGEDLLAYLNPDRPAEDAAVRDRGGATAIVLLDLHMPRMNGKETLGHIRHDPRLNLLPVVVLTTSDNDRHVQEMYGLGANSYIVKPNDFTALVATVETLNKFWFGAARLPKI